MYVDILLMSYSKVMDICSLDINSSPNNVISWSKVFKGLRYTLVLTAKEERVTQAVASTGHSVGFGDSGMMW